MLLWMLGNAVLTTSIIWLEGDSCSVVNLHEDSPPPTKYLRAEGPFARYFLEFRGIPDPSLPPPVFIAPQPGQRTQKLKPRIAVEPIVPTHGDDVVYFFEIDTVSSFNSPNLLKTPMLLPLTVADDVTSARGLFFHLLRSQHIHDIGGEPEITFPFRVSAMRLPQSQSFLTPGELRRHAVALGWGLEGDSLIKEVFAYVRSQYLFASDTVSLDPEETFRRDLAECGHVNALAGTYLGLNGYKTRRVSGRFPRVSDIYPGGGHTALEVWHNDSWRYIDPYLDVLLDLSSRQIGALDQGPEIIVFRIAPRWHATHGETVRIQDLFDARSYSPLVSRVVAIQAPDDAESEDAIGLDWPLPETPGPFTRGELFDNEIQLYVRSRYAVGPGLRMLPRNARKSDFREVQVSEWATTTFTADLGDLADLQ